ncbi:hypothetical protein B0H16DRAFT_1460602 [Mycena metata]|uniref:Uncharacterized protein n=1 Tax=Mycena metata TaxID=1033252 RepID=A0AAD7IUQ9_9AGAR|nr:hypothetical protein B0H16DRAFT_1466902 [Mycena metata]KAJ7750900.1 hypothetical protein B0H16DRAFT_1460602 [Mycena metata]
MHHTIFVPIILWFISPVLGNTLRYIILALVLTAFTAYAANLCGASRRLARLEDAIEATEAILTRATENCSRDYLELIDLADCLIQASLKIMERIDECTKKVEEINTSVLRIMEGERQHRLKKSSKEKREIIDAITPPSTREPPRNCLDDVVP